MNETYILGHIPKKAGSEGSELGFYRKKLIDFLQGSTYYRPEELLPRFPMNGEILLDFLIFCFSLQLYFHGKLCAMKYCYSVKFSCNFDKGHGIKQ